MNLKQNTKFIWIYVAILFSFAIILILFAGLTHNNYQKEITDQKQETAGIRKSLSALSSENEKLSSSIKTLEEEKIALTSENENLKMEIRGALSFCDGDEETTRLLLRAYSLKLDGRNEEAQAMLSETDAKLLTKLQKKLYDMIITGE